MRGSNAAATLARAGGTTLRSDTVPPVLEPSCRKELCAWSAKPRTRTPVYVPLPPDMAAELGTVPLAFDRNPRYFFGAARATRSLRSPSGSGVIRSGHERGDANGRARDYETRESNFRLVSSGWNILDSEEDTLP